MGLEWLLGDVGFIPNLNINVENLSFIVSRTLARVHIPVYVYACMKLVYGDLEHAYTYVCLYTHALRFSWPSFPKIDLFSS